MDFIKQTGKDHLIQRLYVHWDITTMCQYHCSYCYAKAEYRDKWMQLANWEKQKHVIDELSKSTLPVFLGLLGGEPTLHPKYWELMDLLYVFLDKHDKNRVYITTNGTKDIDFFRKHTYNKKVRFLWSYHAEEGDPKVFLENIKVIVNKGFRSRVNVMLHPNKKYWQDLKDIITELDKIDVEIHPHFIYSSPHKTVKYSKDFYEFFAFTKKYSNKDFTFYTINNSYNYSDIEIFDNKYNQFKGWKCWNNNYEINLNCEMHQFCFEDKHQIPKDYFKNITKITPIICPHKFCSCDGLLKIRKEK